MKYIGSKRLISKYILPVMLQHKKNYQWIEPFVGGANIIKNVTGTRLGYDSNKFLISLLKSIRDGWSPPFKITEEIYNDIKKNKKNYNENIVGFAGFLLSFGATFFGSWARGDGRDFFNESLRSIERMRKDLAGVVFNCCDFTEIKLNNKSLIYCDPPYKGTYSYGIKFDHDLFYAWCRGMSKKGHIVYVSEYSMPEDFICVKKVEHITSLARKKSSQRIEKLFLCKT